MPRKQHLLPPIFAVASERLVFGPLIHSNDYKISGNLSFYPILHHIHHLLLHDSLSPTLLHLLPIPLPPIYFTHLKPLLPLDP